MQNEGITVGGLDRLGEIAEVLLHVDEPAGVISEDEESMIESNIDRRWLNGSRVEGVDGDRSGIEMLADGAVAQNHGNDASGVVHDLNKRETSSEPTVPTTDDLYARHMATRLLAGVILLAGLVLLGVVTLGGGAETQSDEVAASGDRTTTPQPDAATSSPTNTATPMLEDAPDNFGPRKDLVELDGWLNTDINGLSDLDGKVIVVEMWTFGCRNCKARIPHNQELYASHSRTDFEIVGVHAPEFSFEAEISNIEQAVLDLGVTWPVALDTNKQNFRAWQDGGRRFWPRTYVIDQNGDVRFDHIGEGKYDELSQTVDWLIANPPT